VLVAVWVDVAVCDVVEVEAEVEEVVDVCLAVVVVWVVLDGAWCRVRATAMPAARIRTTAATITHVFVETASLIFVCLIALCKTI